jgi:hypothetical protein
MNHANIGAVVQCQSSGVGHIGIDSTYSSQPCRPRWQYCAQQRIASKLVLLAGCLPRAKYFSFSFDSQDSHACKEMALTEHHVSVAVAVAVAEFNIHCERLLHS